MLHFVHFWSTLLTIVDESALSKFTYGEPGFLIYGRELSITNISLACNLEISESKSYYARAYRWTYLIAMDDGFDNVDNVK